MVKKYHAYKQVAKFSLTSQNVFRKDYGQDKFISKHTSAIPTQNKSKIVEKFYYKLQASHVKLSPNARLAVLNIGFDPNNSQHPYNGTGFERPMTIHCNNILNMNEIKAIKSDGTEDNASLGAELATFQVYPANTGFFNSNPDYDYISLRNYSGFLNNLIEITFNANQLETTETGTGTSRTYSVSSTAQPIFGIAEEHTFNITLVVYDIDEEVLNEGMSVYENKTYQFHNQAQQGSKYQI